MDLNELKHLREEKLLEHKRKKRAYYLKSKMQKKQKRAQKVAASIDYEVELFGGNFADKLKEIAKKQMLHVQSREDVIKNKIDEYKKKKKEYYKKNREKILEQQKANRLKKKMDTKDNGE